ncbi:MAG: alpha/beta fold hydrolase [Clostridia bacterium]|nr:alpha/beta fold hydrolase [Clostridia bacterium]
MKFYESGPADGRTILLLPGNFMTHRQFENIIPLLAEEYRVVAVDFDGYDETGETTYTTAQDQAQKLADYIREQLGGAVDLVYAESLGSCPAAFLTRHHDIRLGGVILSGVQYLHWGVLDPIIVAVSSRLTHGVMRRFVRQGSLKLPAFLVRSLGRDGESMNALVKQLCRNASLETTRATFVTGTEFYPRHVQRWAPDAGVHIALWYGGKEKNMAKAENELRRAFPGLTVRIFQNMGHGENVEHPELVVRELKAFMGW